MRTIDQETVLNDRYQLGEELGRGGMGTVYRAHDKVLDRAVAVKVLSQSGLGTEGRGKLLTEAQAVAKLNHPNIVTVHDAGEFRTAEESEQLVPYIVMELVEGKSLLERRPEGFEAMVEMGLHVCAALEHAHQNGIIHRDLKPENIILEPDGTAKLMDFGLARSMATRVSVEGDIVGTVFYLAPEQAMGRDLDGRADLYSLGVILYELTTGELPFVHEDPLAVVSQHLHATVLPPRSKNPEIPPLLEQLILNLLEKDPADRPESAAALAGLLNAPELLNPEAETDKQLSVIARIVRGRFVGREQELRQAKSAWSKALGGAGQTLLVSGEPGIGKSRLARELATHVEVSGGRALIGECYAEGGAPYAAFAQIVRHALRGQSSNGFKPPDFVLADLLALVPELRPYYPDIQQNPPLEPEAEQQRLFENMVAFCESLAEHRPLLIVVDDAHWGDSGTLAMMRHLARRIQHQRTLLLATYREVELDVARPFHEVLLDINRARLGSRLKLERFNKEQTRELLNAIFEEAITPEFLEGIYRETEGNPFYIEEVCKALVEEGRVYYQDGRWHRPDDISELEIPQSVRVAIQTRLARLPEMHQEALSLAAILGREFDFEVLAQASALAEDDLIEALESAEAAQLIEESGDAGELTFRFVHALIPSALAEGVRKLRRRKLHRRAAAAIRAISPENYESLAHHYSEAGDNDNALSFYIKAGKRAAAAFANQEAEDLLLSALDLSDDPAEQAELMTALGRVQTRQGRYERAILTWQKAIELSIQLEQPDQAARLYASASGAAWDSGDPERGLALAKQGIEALTEAPEGPGLADLYHEASRAYFFNSLNEQGTRLGKRALAVAESAGDLRVQSEALITLGTFAELPLQEAIRMKERGLEVAQEAGLADQESRALNNLTHSYSFGLGDHSQAREFLLRAVQLATSSGNTGLEVFYRINSAYISAMLGELEAAQTALDQAHQILQKVEDQAGLGLHFEGTQGVLLRHRGDFANAAPLLESVFQTAHHTHNANLLYLAAINLAEIALITGEGLDGAEEALIVGLGIEPHWGGTAWPLGLLSRIHSRSEALDQAMARLSEAQAILDKENWAVDRIWISLAKSQLAFAQAQWDAAWEGFEAAVNDLRKFKMRGYLGQTLLEWGWLKARSPEPAGAAQLLKQARHEFQAINASGFTLVAEERLAQLDG